MIDINTFIVITVLSICLATIIRVFQGIIPKNDGWILISFIVILITVFLLIINSVLSAYIGGILLTIFIIIPQWGFRRVNRLFEIKNYQKSRQLLSKLMYLHFTQYWRNFYQLLWALELANNGNVKKAVTILNIKDNHLPIFHYYYQVFTYEILGNWQMCLQWFEHQIDQKILFSDSILLTYYLRALGETGNLNQLFQNILTVQSILLKQKKYSDISRIKLYSFAFSGQIVAIKKLFESELSFYPEHLQLFWLVTAKTVTDQNNDNYRILIRKYLHHHHILRSSIEWRLERVSIPFLETIKNSQYSHLYKISLIGKKVNANSNIVRFKNNPITLLLIIINFLVFVTQISFGGSENFETLYQLGALRPIIVWQGEYWRIITANFLHYGWGHFLMNMLALYFIGNLVEFLSKKFHYIMIYVISGVGSMFVFSYLAVYIHDVDYILVGASASIMGLVGSLTAIFLRRWLSNKSSLNLKKLLMMVVVITLQLISDYLIPQVSMLSHLFGLLIGFMIEIFIGLLHLQKT
ncbi:MAG: rhomboid family intramembrane serine protease [Crocosphaera sp.]